MVRLLTTLPQRTWHRYAWSEVLVIGLCLFATLGAYWGNLPAGWHSQPAAPQGIVERTDTHVLTDLGIRIPVYEANNAVPVKKADENALVISLGLDGAVTQTAPADPSYNCHGWVFTGGRYHVNDVEVILHDNGYRQVADVRVGDVVVFRKAGYITHTGVVAEIGYDGSVIVESKWSLLGRYLHRATDQTFGNEISYYRSNRSGHLLAGI